MANLAGSLTITPDQIYYKIDIFQKFTAGYNLGLPLGFHILFDKLRNKNNRRHD